MPLVVRTTWRVLASTYPVPTTTGLNAFARSMAGAAEGVVPRAAGEFPPSLSSLRGGDVVGLGVGAVEAVPATTIAARATAETAVPSRSLNLALYAVGRTGTCPSVVGRRGERKSSRGPGFSALSGPCAWST